MPEAFRSIDWLGVTVVARCSSRATNTMPLPKNGDGETQARWDGEDHAANEAREDSDGKPNTAEPGLSEDLTTHARY